MKAIRKGSGMQFTVVPATKIEAGDVVIQGGLIGVAAYPIPASEAGVVEREGDFECIYDGAAAATQGAKAYWDATAKKVTATSTNNTAIGLFALAVASGATVCRVILG